MVSSEKIDELFKQAQVDIIHIKGERYALLPASNLVKFYKAGIDEACDKIVEKVKP